MTFRWVLPVALAFSVVLPASIRAAGQKSVKSNAKSSTGTAASPSSGSALNFADQGPNDNPVQIFADQGLEMSQDAKTVIARVNAKAIRGDVTINADVLIAHFRDKKGAAGTPGTASAPNVKTPPAPPASATAASATVGTKPAAASGAQPDDTSGSEVWRVEAHGHVVINNPSDTAYGDNADYNIDDAVVVLTGKDLKLVTPTQTVTARDSLEYWEGRQQAVARGNALAVRQDDHLQADLLTAEFAKDADGHEQIQTMHAFDHVVVTTPTEIGTGDRGVYNLENGIVTLTGSVKMTRDKNQLDGGYAIVNLNTGISQVFPEPPGKTGGEGRVRALLVPQSRTPSQQPAASSGQ